MNSILITFFVLLYLSDFNTTNAFVNCVVSIDGQNLNYNVMIGDKNVYNVSKTSTNMKECTFNNNVFGPVGIQNNFPNNQQILVNKLIIDLIWFPPSPAYSYAVYSLICYNSTQNTGSVWNGKIQFQQTGVLKIFRTQNSYFSSGDLVTFVFDVVWTSPPFSVIQYPFMCAVVFENTNFPSVANWILTMHMSFEYTFI